MAELATTTMEVPCDETVENPKTIRGEKKKAKSTEKKTKELRNQGEVHHQIRACSNNIYSNDGDVGSGIGVSMFDYSAENHFQAIDTISKICGEQDSCSFDVHEIERFASSIIFLSEWRYFNYGPRTIRFVPEIEVPSKDEGHNEISLSQFSAASVPKGDTEVEKVSGAVSTELRKDFVLYVGGLVWALDWCPRPDQETNCDTKCQFIAVAAHPPDSTYHKLGACLSGRGMIQVWCLLNCTSAKEDMQAPVGNRKYKTQKNNSAKKEENKPKRARGRPRKSTTDKTPADTDLEGGFTQALVVRPPENASHLLPLDESIPTTPLSLTVPVPVGNTNAVAKEDNKPKKPKGRPRKNAVDKSLVVVDPEGQLVVQLSEDTPIVPPVNGNVQSNPVQRKEKGKKRKTVTNGKNTVDKTADVPGSEEPFLQALAVEFPENMPSISSEDSLLNSPQVETFKKQKVPTKRSASDLECTLSDLRKKSRRKSKPKVGQGHDEMKLPNQNEIEEPSLGSMEEAVPSKDDMVSEGIVTGDSCSNLGSGGSLIPNHVAIPRVVFCLGHDGKIAWDVKWWPFNSCESVNQHRIGYLAVVLGNGYIEV